jgi:TolA-binding protein
MRLKVIAPLVVLLALTGCSKVEDAPNTSTLPTNSSSADTSQSSDDVTAIREVATIFMQSMQIVDFESACNNLVNQADEPVTSETLPDCTSALDKSTNGTEMWKQLTPEQQKTITDSYQTIKYIGTPTITGDTATSDSIWEFKGEQKTDVSPMKFVKVKGRWYVKYNPAPAPSAS